MLNFNTFSEALMACFAVLVNTQAPLMMEGAMAGLNSWGPALLFLFFYLVLVCIVSNVCIALVMQAYAAVASTVRHRLQGKVELWEHLLAAAEAQLHASDPRSFPYTRSWSFQRPLAFMALNEALFGRTLSLQFWDATPSDRPVVKPADAHEAGCVADLLNKVLPASMVQCALGTEGGITCGAAESIVDKPLRIHPSAVS